MVSCWHGADVGALQSGPVQSVGAHGIRAARCRLMFGYRTITIAAPQCAPVRVQITRTETMLKRYGFAYLRITDGGAVKEGKQVLYNRVHVTVRDKAANWCEYLLCRAGHGLLTAPINPKNLEYARKWLDSPAASRGWYDGNHAGAKLPPGAVISEINDNPNMPPAWQDQPRQPGRSKRRRAAKSGIGKVLKEWFS